MEENKMQRHMGQIANTSRKCIVIFLEIPGKEDHSLVVDLDALPDRHAQTLRELALSPDGQKSVNLGDFLHRRKYEESSQNFLEMLHLNRYLLPVEHTNLIMNPEPGRNVPMTEIIKGYRASNGIVEEELDPKVKAEMEKAEAKVQETVLDPVVQAEQLLKQSAEMEAQAKSLKEQAYALNPELKPKRARKTPPKK